MSTMLTVACKPSLREFQHLHDFPVPGQDVHLKLEGLNPTGSIKFKPAQFYGSLVKFATLEKKESVNVLLISDFLVDMSITEGTEFTDSQHSHKRRKCLTSVFW